MDGRFSFFISDTPSYGTNSLALLGENCPRNRVFDGCTPARILSELPNGALHPSGCSAARG